MVHARKSYVVGTEKLRILEEVIEYTKHIACKSGQRVQQQEIDIATSLKNEQKDIKKVVAQRRKLKHVTSEQQVE